MRSQWLERMVIWCGRANHLPIVDLLVRNIYIELLHCGIWLIFNVFLCVINSSYDRSSRRKQPVVTSNANPPPSDRSKRSHHRRSPTSQRRQTHRHRRSPSQNHNAAAGAQQQQQPPPPPALTSSAATTTTTSAVSTRGRRRAEQQRDRKHDRDERIASPVKVKTFRLVFAHTHDLIFGCVHFIYIYYTHRHIRHDILVVAHI